ncbi:unnamed protein product [marine sediment metagenome]|uniref:Uncharacterized protein n=1 Tax=marine sediment metagenome TaxID=412755 RepID=X1STL7_9ZZZZ
MLLFLNQRLLYLCTTSGAKGMAPSQSCPTLGTGEFETALKVLDGDRTLGKVYIFDFQGQSLTHTAAQPKQEAN